MGHWYICHSVVLDLVLDVVLISRRRIRDLKVPAYTVAESERAAGLGVDNKQRGVEDVVKRMEGMSGVQEEKEQVSSTVTSAAA